eukprot:SAG31_NODE_9709_length_1239_cov_0.933333_2_plen_97_part_00
MILIYLPGIGFHIFTTLLRLHTSGQVLLGIGMATLVPSNGNTVIDVAADAHGVRVAGLLIDAGDEETKHLVGDEIYTISSLFSFSNSHILYTVNTR